MIEHLLVVTDATFFENGALHEHSVALFHCQRHTSNDTSGRSEDTTEQARHSSSGLIDATLLKLSLIHI